MGLIGSGAWGGRSPYLIPPCGPTEEGARPWLEPLWAGPQFLHPLRTGSGVLSHRPARADTAPWRPRASSRPSARHGAQRGSGAGVPQVTSGQGTTERLAPAAGFAGLGLHPRAAHPALHSPRGRRRPLPILGLSLRRERATIVPTPRLWPLGRPLRLLEPRFPYPRLVPWG